MSEVNSQFYHEIKTLEDAKFGTLRDCGTSVCACVWNVRWNVCELCKSVLLHKRVTFPLHLMGS